MPTRSPSLTWPTPAPTATTLPTPSWPGMNGGCGFTGQSPSAACRSVWHTPQAAICTSTSPGPGRGTGTSSITSGWPNARTTAAFMVLSIATPRGKGRTQRYAGLAGRALEQVEANYQPTTKADGTHVGNPSAQPERHQFRPAMQQGCFHAHQTHVAAVVLELVVARRQGRGLARLQAI